MRFLLLLLIAIPLLSSGQSFYYRYYYSSFDMNATDVVELPDGSILSVAANLRYSILLKLDHLGEIQWHVRYDSIMLKKISLLPNGELLLMGEKKGVFLAKTDSLGNISWSNVYAKSAATQGYDLLVARNGDYVITAADSARVILMRLNPAGQVKWSKRYYNNTPHNAVASNIVENADGSLIFLSSVSDMQSPHDNNFKRKAAVIKTDSVGTILWAKTITPTYNVNVQPYIEYTHPVHVFVASDGSIIVNYWKAWESFFGGPQYHVLKLDGNGTLMWAGLRINDAPAIVASENPVGQLNFAFLGGTTADVAFPVYSGILTTDLDFNHLNQMDYAPFKKQVYLHRYLFSGIKQLNDGRFLFFGKEDRPSPRLYGMTFLAVEQDLTEDCSGMPADNLAWELDSFVVITDVTLTMDTGITVTTTSIHDTFMTLNHCDCADLPSAHFGMRLAGDTVFVTDSSLNAVSYRWYFAGGGFDTAANPIYVYPDSVYGTISMEVTNPCGTHTIWRNVMHDSVPDTIPVVPGIMRIQQGFRVYPNPTNDLLHVETEMPVDKLVVINLLGQTLVEANNTNSIGTNTLKVGMYFLAIESNGVRKVFSFLKE